MQYSLASIIISAPKYSPDLVADLLQLPEAVGVAALRHRDRLLDHLHLALLVVQVLVQLRLQLKVRPVKYDVRDGKFVISGFDKICASIRLIEFRRRTWTLLSAS